MYMDWHRLLSRKRSRAFLGAAESVQSNLEHRSEQERDCGRAIYSAPFRRLKQKAQVFLSLKAAMCGPLLHSLEVSSVAEDLASQIVNRIKDIRQLNEKLQQAIPLVAATCGLIHDLGNPLEPPCCRKSPSLCVFT